MRRLLRVGLYLLALYLIVVVLALSGAGLARRSHAAAMARLQDALQVKDLTLQAQLETQIIHHVTLTLLLDPERLDLAPQKTAAFDRILEHYRAMRTKKLSRQLSELLTRLETMHDQQLTPLDTSVLEQIYTDPVKAKSLFQRDYEPVLREYDQLSRETVQLAEQESQEARLSLANQANQMVTTSLLALGVLGLGGVVGLVLLLASTRKLSQRLESAVAVLKQVSGGDLDARIEVGHDESSEFRVIFEAFNDMVLKIRHRDERLHEEKIRVESMISDLRQHLEHMQVLGTRLTGSTEEIAGQLRDQEVSAAEQAASSVSVSGSSTQISTVSRELVETMDKVARLCETTINLAQSGEQSQTELRQVMESIRQESDSILNDLTALHEQAVGIGQVITTLTNISDQTNLLSLNASLEASRAGEAGRGFTVVAREIGRLSQHTAKSVLEIEETLQRMQQAVQASLGAVNKFSKHLESGTRSAQAVGEQLTLIGGQVLALGPRFENVKAGMEQQHSGATHISTAMREIAAQAQRNLSGLRRTNMALSRAQDIAKDLREVAAKDL